MPILVLAAISGLIGAFWAQSKNKNALLWGVLCALFPVVGLLFLAMSSREESPEEKMTKSLIKAGVINPDIASRSSNNHILAAPIYGGRDASNLPNIQNEKFAYKYDVAKWKSLVELDEEISDAAARARKMGEQYEDLLAEKYLPLNDKKYLLAALTKVIQKANSDLVMSAIEAERKQEESESKKLEDAAFMENVLNVGRIGNSNLYTMKDGTVALECDDGERRIFANRHEAQRYTVSCSSIFRK